MTKVLIDRLDETVVDGQRLGRHVEHDERSRGYAVAELPRVQIVEAHHERFGGPLDQGDLGSCTGNAMVGWLNSAPAATAKSKLYTEADAVRIYSAATHLDHIRGIYPPDDTGSSGLAVCKAAQREGRISSYRHAFSLHGALSALMTSPVLTGVPWYEGFDRPDARGLVEIAGQIRGGHEFEVVEFVPAVGDAAILDGVVGAWNNWGPSYGDGGRFYFTARTWAELLDQYGDATVPIL